MYLPHQRYSSIMRDGESLNQKKPWPLSSALRPFCSAKLAVVGRYLQSRKDWCQQNEIPQSTLNYWIRKIQLEAPETEPASDPVFAKLPSEQELQFNAGTGNRSVTILLPENIQIEIGADCPARLLTTLLQVLKNYA